MALYLYLTLSFCFALSYIKHNDLSMLFISIFLIFRKGKRKVQGVSLLQAAALPRYQEEEETDKTKQPQIEQTYEKH